jgi:hypothetical protein
MAGQICLPRGHPGIAMNIYSTEKNMNRDIFGCPISRPVSNVKTIKKIKKNYGGHGVIWLVHSHSFSRPCSPSNLGRCSPQGAKKTHVQHHIGTCSTKEKQYRI